MSIISDNLRKARKAVPGLTQLKASKLLSVSRPTLGAWEEGRSTPTLNKLAAIGRLYHVTDWEGFTTEKHWDPRKQKATTLPFTSLIEKQYHRLPKKLKKVADELLNLA